MEVARREQVYGNSKGRTWVVGLKKGRGEGSV